MKGGTRFETRGVTYELEIAIDAPRERVWRSLTDGIDAWWLPDFHMTGEGSVVTFDARAGGGIVERHPSGSELLWYTVQWIRPRHFTVYLVGHSAADWGGPATSSMKLEVTESGGGSVLRVTDSIFGHIDDENIGSLQHGWTQLFTEGLKKHAEA